MVSYTALVNLGYVLNLLSLTIRDVLWLRAVMLCAQCALGGGALVVANYNVLAWNSVFALVNGYHVVRILRERRPIPIPDELRDIYRSVFANLTPRNFLYFWQTGQVREAADELLVREGTAPQSLLLVLSGHAVVERAGREIGRLGRGCFIAEISFLTREPASADVWAREPLRFIAWEQDKLRQLSRLDPELYQHLQQILSRDLARKVRSTPPAQAA